jgi:hypothetical protein
MIDLLAYDRLATRIHRPMAARPGNQGDRPALGPSLWDGAIARPSAAARRQDRAAGTWRRLSSAARNGATSPGTRLTCAAGATRTTHDAGTRSPAVTFVAVPEFQEILRILNDLQARMATMEQTRVSPALPASPVTPASPTTPAAPLAPAPPAPERKDIQQWTIRMSKAWIEYLKAVAYDQRRNPSELVEAWIWQQAYRDRSSSTP